MPTLRAGLRTSPLPGPWRSCLSPPEFEFVVLAIQTESLPPIWDVTVPDTPVNPSSSCFTICGFCAGFSHAGGGLGAASALRGLQRSGLGLEEDDSGTAFWSWSGHKLWSLRPGRKLCWKVLTHTVPRRDILRVSVGFQFPGLSHSLRAWCYTVLRANVTWHLWNIHPCVSSPSHEVQREHVPTPIGLNVLEKPLIFVQCKNSRFLSIPSHNIMFFSFSPNLVPMLWLTMFCPCSVAHGLNTVLQA